MFTYLKQIWNTKELRNRILFTIAILVLYRFIAQISVPGANQEILQQIQGQQNELLQVLSLLTGGSTENFSIVLMGIGPYINAVIIMQLLQVVSPKLESIAEEGESGKRKLNGYTHWLTLPLAFLQSYGMLVLLNSSVGGVSIIDTTSISVLLPMITVTAGTILLVWLGELITEKGIGNGISLLIFTSIMSQIPGAIGSGISLATGDQQALVAFLAVLIITVLLVIIVVLVNEADRKIPLTYAGQGMKSKADQAFLPIKINQAGMIPIIFAVALITFPGIIGQFMASSTSPTLQTISSYLTSIFTVGSWSYASAYFFLTLLFTFFYVSITFKPSQIAESIQKRGGYIPGIRPGKQTIDYIQTISRRLTLFGALFLAIIAIIPIVLNSIFRTGSITAFTLVLSGAGIIIIVGVVLELLRQINASMVMHDYKKFY
ncbi:preprotein translocase subunit SecY [Candidatus Peregrinibacteria bacterium HGW-Peregrinibacteria-1]|jgi:preprotein translocase subunit SecY|nr:MAG: preprotein translocase subunit SecY [Candidatus Peregrinibacteria bacterium HGW-Peregrinibacteria-1]